MIRRSRFSLYLAVHRLFCYQKIRSNNGFTLIELLVVMLILAILAAMALPAYFNQVGRAREAEAKQILSAIVFAQQGYFFENATFANNYDALEVTFQSQNYTFPAPTLVNATVFKSQANAINAINKNTRNYGMGVYYENSVYQIVLCQSESPASITVAPDASSDDCSNNGKKAR